jgi:hypothetical protein
MYDDIIKTILRNLDMRVWSLAKLTQNKAQWQAVSGSAIIYTTIIFRRTLSWISTEYGRNHLPQLTVYPTTLNTEATGFSKRSINFLSGHTASHPVTFTFTVIINSNFPLLTL